MFLSRHNKTRALLSSYIDGELKARENGKLEKHLAVCPSCRAELKDLQATLTLLKSVRPLNPARNFTVQASQKSRPRPSSPLWQPIPVPIVVSVLITMGLFFGDFFHYLPFTGNEGSGLLQSASVPDTEVRRQETKEVIASKSMANPETSKVNSAASPLSREAVIGESPVIRGGAAGAMAGQATAVPPGNASAFESQEIGTLASTPAGKPAADSEPGTQKLITGNFSPKPLITQDQPDTGTQDIKDKNFVTASEKRFFIIPWRLLEFLFAIISVLIIMNTVLIRRRLR